jgi:hypothetical protein
VTTDGSFASPKPCYAVAVWRGVSLGSSLP